MTKPKIVLSSRLEVRFKDSTQNVPETRDTSGITPVTLTGNNTTNPGNQRVNLTPPTGTLLTQHNLRPTISNVNIAAFTAPLIPMQIVGNSTPNTDNGLNISYRFETRGILKLPIGKLL